MAEIVRVTDNTPKAEIEGLLVMANADTKRLPRIIERFTTNPPSDWSDAHAFLNELLDDWQAAPADAPLPTIDHTPERSATWPS
jgi:hypothetical protein